MKFARISVLCQWTDVLTAFFVSQKNERRHFESTQLLDLRTSTVALSLAAAGVLGCAQAHATPPEYHELCKAHWADGFSHDLRIQAPDEEAVKIVPDPLGTGQKVLRVQIYRDKTYTHVANGVPRGEVAFFPCASIAIGKDYWIDWSVMLGAGYQFDKKQAEIISQIHQSANAGSPPFALLIENGRYTLAQRGGLEPQSVARLDLGPIPAADVGNWVNWALHYIPDETGARSVTELYKNGKLVSSVYGKPNSYPSETRAYWKVGVYKWWWETRPSDVTERTVYYGDVHISGKQ